MPFPAHDSENSLHREVADLALSVSEKVREYLAEQGLDEHGGNMTTRETGIFRKKVRSHIVQEVEEIDRRVAKLCGL